ncbi:hypothetical protein BH10ACT10_BH10ACT10_09830 [soil metagenome]
MTPEVLTVGVVTPHRAPGPDVELPAMTYGRVATVVSRTRSSPEQPPDLAAHAELRASTTSAALDRAAKEFGDRTLAAVAHASTTSGYVIGGLAEADLLDRVSRRFGVPALASCAATADALHRHQVDRVQLVHPPWFDDAFDKLGATYFRSHGFDPIVTRASDLPDDPARVHPQDVVDWLAHHVEDRSQAMFLAGNGFRSVGAIDEIERRTGRLVVTANQAMLWGVLTATGTCWDITGHGRLLRADASAT